MTPIFMESLLLTLLLIIRELFPEEMKEKSEFSKLEDKLKLWKLQWKNIEEEFGQYKFELLMTKPLVLLLMDLVLFGISETSLESIVFKTLINLSLNKFYIILMKVNSLLLDLIEKSLIELLMMDKLLEWLMDLKKEKLML